MKDNIKTIKKTCNYCIECKRNYALDMQICPKCGEKMFPVPYTPLDVEKT